MYLPFSVHQSALLGAALSLAFTELSGWLEEEMSAAHQVLILDEISMVSAEFFAQLEQAMRKIRFTDKPFGGIQLVLCGDYFQ